MSSSKKKESLRPGEWAWSDEDQLYVRELYDRNGNFVKFDYHQTESVPRLADVESLATDIGNVNIGGNEAYQDAGAYTHHAAAQTTTSGSHEYSHAAPSKSSSSKGKGKEIKYKSSSSSSKTGSSSTSKPKSSSHRSAGRLQEAETPEEPFYSVPQADHYTSPPHDPYSSPHDPPGITSPSDTFYSHHGSGQVGKEKWYSDETQPTGDYDKGYQQIDSLTDDAGSNDPNYYVEDRSAKDEHAPSHHSKSRKGKGVAHNKAPSVSFDIPEPPPNELDEDEDDPELQAAIQESQRRYRTGGRHGQSSSQPLDNTYEDQAEYYPDDHAGETTPRAATPARKATVYDSTYDYDDDPSIAPAPDDTYDPAYTFSEQPAPSTPGLDHITGDPSTGMQEKLDPRFVIHPSHTFHPGEVFKVLWSEPAGSAKETTMTENELRTSYGESFYVCFRRFVVIANDEGHCTCVPILTYERRGCSKRGVKPQKHGIVYSSNGKPKMVEGEPKLGFKPVRVQLIKNEKLAPQSRINYSKLVTVEHNVKVFFIGSIVFKDFIEIVSPAVDQCWTDKKREYKRHHSKSGGY